MNQIKKQRLLAFLDENKVDALLFWQASDVMYAVERLPQWGISTYFLTKDGTEILLAPYLEPEIVNDGLACLQTFGWGDPSCSDPWGEYFLKIKNLIQKHGVKILAVPEGSGHTTLAVNSAENAPYPHDFWQKLSQTAALHPISHKLSTLYMYKTTPDIEGIRKVHRSAAKAVSCFYEMLQPGVAEIEIAAEMEKIIRLETDGKHIKFSQAWAFINAGPHSAQAWKYGRNEGYILQAGDAAMLEFALCIDGYWADISRTGFAGKPSSLYQELYILVDEAQTKAAAMLSPEVRASDVHNSIIDFYKKHKIEKYYHHATGHHTGFRYHDPGFMINQASDGVFKENMVVTIEPGLYLPEKSFGCRIEDNILITKSGGENLSLLSQKAKI